MIFIELCKELIMKDNGVKLSNFWKRIAKRLNQHSFLLQIPLQVLNLIN